MPRSPYLFGETPCEWGTVDVHLWISIVFFIFVYIERQFDQVYPQDILPLAGPPRNCCVPNSSVVHSAVRNNLTRSCTWAIWKIFLPNTNQHKWNSQLFFFSPEPNLLMWLEDVRAAATSVSLWSRTDFPSEKVWVRCAFGNDYMKGCSLFNLPCLLGLRVFTTDSPWKPKLIKFEKRIPPEREAWEFPEEQGCRSRLSEGVRSLLNILQKEINVKGMLNSKTKHQWLNSICNFSLCQGRR